MSGEITNLTIEGVMEHAEAAIAMPMSIDDAVKFMQDLRAAVRERLDALLDDQRRAQ